MIFTLGCQEENALKDWIKKQVSMLSRTVTKTYKFLKKHVESLVMRKKGTLENGNEYKFQKLTPDSNVELNVYKEAFDYIFSNPDVINVAISGAYGAGKSSVIASYKKMHSHIRFVHVSLARFRPTVDTVEESPLNESALEGKILNQVIHQIPSYKIPQTNFKVKRSVKPLSFIFSTLLTMLLAFSALHIFLFQKWTKYVSTLPTSDLRNLLVLSTNKQALLVSGALGVVISSIFLYKFIKVQLNRNVFRKISLQGNEIEIFEESNESYFDKYLNEVLYLFENIKADVIVFEDMDRFNVSGIFERLREINTLINTQRIKDKKLPIRFFYLLRDDIFISKDRTKFFDYIIPIVPVVDSSNSYDQFISHFKESDVFEFFDENFLQGLSLYIDDMRLLKNIYNEFVIYYNRLNTTELDCNRMLAMIAYKNLFPRDFSDLQINQGMFFALFAKKDDFIENEITRIDTLVQQKKVEISNLENEQLTSIQELDDVYTAKRNRLSNNWSNRTEIQEMEKELSLRKEVLEKKLNNLLPILKEELVTIQQEIANTKNKKFMDLITRDNIESIFKLKIINEIGIETNFHEIKGNEYFDLLKYLLRNGYIDETYPDYMTYFYENSLSRVDKTFLRSITDRKAKDYTYELKNLNLVISRVREVDFDQEEILNFDLLEYLLQTRGNVIYLNRFMRQLRETRNFEFVGAFFDTQRELPSFTVCLNHQWSKMFLHALNGKHLSVEQLRLHSIYTLYYSNEDEIQGINSENCLTNYISSSNDYLDINEPNVKKLILGFIQLGVSFKGINQANVELLEEVYINSLYEINFENLSLMLTTYYSIDNDYDIHHKNYTLINSQPQSPLANFIEENLSDYVNILLLNCKNAITDAEKIVIQLLNSEKVSIDQKSEYIGLLQTSVTLINEIEDANLWSSLLKNYLVKYSEENIIQYFILNKELDTVLIEFINSDANQLNFIEIKKNHVHENVEEFFDAILVCNELSNHKYREILLTIDLSCNVFDKEVVSTDKLRIIIDEKIVQMNLETLYFLREHYPHQVLYFIESNINEYVSIMTAEAFLLDEVVQILSLRIENDTKIELLGMTSEPISILNERYSNRINVFILKNNFDSNDLVHLVKYCEKWDNEVQQVVYDLARDNMRRIISESMKISDNLLKKLFESNEIEHNPKIELLISSLSDIDEEICKEYLEILDLIEYKKIFEPRTRPKYEFSQTNEKLLSAFKKKGWINDYENDTDREGYYKIIRNRPLLRSSSQLL